MQTVLVLGSTGTQGGAVCRHLSARGGMRVLGITRNAQSAKEQRVAKLLAVFARLSGRPVTANELPVGAFSEASAPLFEFMRDEGWQSIDIEALGQSFPRLHTVASALVEAGWRAVDQEGEVANVPLQT